MKIKTGFQPNSIFNTVNVLLLVRDASTLSIKILSIKGDEG